MSGGQKTEQGYMGEYTEKYLEKVFYFCLKKTGNRQEAEDLASEVSLCIFSELRRGVIPERFSAWVWQIARNRYSRWADAKHKRAERFSEADIGECDIPGGETVEERFVREQETALLRRELALVSAEYRNVLVAYYIEDLPVREVARRLGLTVEAAKKRLLRAREILKGGMNMAREFGIKSYNPEEIGIVTSGNQSSGLPWKAVDRKIPKNILLQASNNPSTVEELAMELGVAAPYMEEEVERLVRATLLKKLGKKYVTNFYIEEAERQQRIYALQRRASGERSALTDEIAREVLPKLRQLGAAGEQISDADLKWWLVIYIVDFCIKRLDGYCAEWPERRENGETWGIMGYESAKLPEECAMGHSGCETAGAAFWTYEISDYGMWTRAGRMTCQEALLLGDLLKNGRSLCSLSEAETAVWNGIDGRFAHEGENKTAAADLLVFRGDAIERVREAVAGHAAFEALRRNIQQTFDGTLDILRENHTEVLRRQLRYCATMDILNIRMMTVRDEVESGRLTVPEDPDRSTAAMWLELK